MKRNYAVSFDINFYIEIEAKNEEEAIEKAIDMRDTASEGEPRNLEIEEVV